jgi:hypothetical protein
MEVFATLSCFQHCLVESQLILQLVLAMDMVNIDYLADNYAIKHIKSNEDSPRFEIHYDYCSFNSLLYLPSYSARYQYHHFNHHYFAPFMLRIWPKIQNILIYQK